MLLLQPWYCILLLECRISVILDIMICWSTNGTYQERDFLLHIVILRISRPEQRVKRNRQFNITVGVRSARFDRNPRLVALERRCIRCIDPTLRAGKPYKKGEAPKIEQKGLMQSASSGKNHEDCPYH